MYKKKKNILSLIFIIILFIVFTLLFLLVISAKEDCIEFNKKVELCIQLGGMFFTSFALILTYNSLRNEKEQKHLANMPYLIINDIDFTVEKISKERKQLDFDFSIINRGNGIANRIKIVIKKQVDNEELFNKNYTKLDVLDNNNIASLLASIRDELNGLNEKSHYSYSHFFDETLTDEFYVEDYLNENDYKDLIIEITYYNIYGKKYKGIFIAKLDENYDLNEYKEELIEYWLFKRINI